MSQRRNDRLSPKEEVLVGERARAGDVRSQHRLVASCVGLAIVLTRRYHQHRADFDDALQEAYVGLVIASQRFDERRGTRFATYATYWIRAKLFEYQLASATLPIKSTSGRKVYFGIYRATAKLGEGAGDEELAREIGVPEAVVEAVRSALAKNTARIDGDRGAPIPSREESPESVCVDRNLKGVLRREADHVGLRRGRRARMIIDKRILAEDPATLNEIGRRSGVSRERVRQVEQSIVDEISERVRRAAR